MADLPVPISDIADPSQIRVQLLASGRNVHAPLSAVAASSIHGAPTKATPIDADEFGYWDSVGLQAVKTTWANIKATIWTALGSLINGGTGKTTPVDADMFAIADSAASNATKKLTWANLKAGILAYLNTTAKAVPIDADRVWQGDSMASNTPVYSTWTQIKAFLKTYFDTLYQPLAAALTSWAGITRASGFDTFAATPSSANLRALLTDETGTGTAYFAGGALGTPSSGTATNLTGLPIAGISGLGTGADTLLATAYTTGSFTPAFSASGSTFSYALQSGRYTRMGDRVDFAITITLNTSGNTLTANALSITGLPIACGADTHAPVAWQNATSSYVNVMALIASGTTTLQMRGATAAATTNETAQGASALLAAATGSRLMIAGTYFV